MNQSFRAVTAAFFGWAGFFTAVSCFAAQESAVISSTRANLRSAPSASSDVVGTLTKGQSVVVLTRIPVQNPQPEDPPSWARVRLPSTIKVWVYAAFVDPKSGAVTSKELKIRSGPGRNFPAVGELDQGDQVSPVRTVDGWMQIEPPAEAVAYVAGNLLQFTDSVAAADGGTAPKASAGSTDSGVTSNRSADRSQVDRTPPRLPVAGGAAVPPRSAPASTNLVPPAVGAVPTSAGSQTSPSSTTTAPAIVVSTKPLDVPAAVSATTPANSQSVAVTTDSSASASRKTPIQISTRTLNRQPELVYDETRPRRVMREGVVKFSLSPDSPGTYELGSFRHGEDILDYLIVEDPKKSDLSKWRGKRVFIEGDEYRDRRWRTPVLKVISVQAAF